jgi:hypothetical protein
VGTELVSDSVSYFATDFFHYFHVRSLSNLCRNFNDIFAVVNIFNSSLRNILVEHLVIELFWVPIDQPIVQLSTVRLNHI